MDIFEKLLSYFIESFFMVGAGLGLIGIRFKLKKIACISTIQALLVYAVRAFYIKNNIPFGTHTFVLFVCFVGVLKFFGKQKLLDSIISNLISFTVLLAGEGIVLLPLLKLFKMDPNTFTLAFQLEDLLFGILNDTFVIIAFLIGYVFKITIIDFNHFHENNNEG